jgi:cytochrome c biogenesis protein CcdA/thiol-disulfide isomerase/thioredoxin
MAIVLVFAFVAGVLTILSPCILPVVPLVLGTASTGSRRRTAGILAGFTLAFVSITVVLASALAAIGATTSELRIVSALLLFAFGATLAFPVLGRWFESRMGPIARTGNDVARRRRDGFGGGVVLGAAIGLVWAPCVGPIMAAVIATTVLSGPSPDTVAIALAYAAGATIPLLIVSRLGRAAIAALGRPERRARAIQVFGGLTMISALLIATGLDAPLQVAVADRLPADWSTTLASVEDQAPAGEEADVAEDTSTVALDDLGPAPELTGITTWINAEPTTLEALRGKVVLVHFWTFGCINCIHVQPYVKAWYDRYREAGLEIVGVHSPELSYERDIDNVRAAVAKADVRFPVAFDPAFKTWRAYQNRYWPAFYFVDKTGRIRHTHFGEGDYDTSEQVIRQLLAETG